MAFLDGFNQGSVNAIANAIGQFGQARQQQGLVKQQEEAQRLANQRALLELTALQAQAADQQQVRDAAPFEQARIADTIGDAVAGGNLTTQQADAITASGTPEQQLQQLFAATGLLAPGPTEADLLNIEKTRADIALKEAQAAKAGRIDAKESFRTVKGADIGLEGPEAGKLFNVSSNGKVTAAGGGGTTVNVGDQGKFKVPSGFRLAEDGESVVPIPGGPKDPAVLTNRPEAQLKSAGFAERAKAADQALVDLGQATSGEATRSSLGEAVGNALGTVSTTAGDAIEGFIQDETGQQRSQAQQDFITAVLRKESGAAISDEEFARERRKFFPTAADGPDAVRQKQEARQRAIANLTRESGSEPGKTEAQQFTTPGGVSYKVRVK